MTVDDLTQDKVNLETSKILWSELQRFFANGSAIFVAPQLDLLVVAEAFEKDDKACVAAWIADKQVHAVTDQQAIAWLDADIMVWAAVIKPWVLVQPLV